ncbi:MAG: hypothetical protein ACI3ZQ_05750 [Candidatus Cryptobacteroides sp.]
MGDDEGLTTSAQERQASDNPWFAEYADNLCIYYMSIGVSYDEYWYGDYSRLCFYAKSDELKLQRENELAWLQGLYVYEAVGCLAPILHAFAKRGTRPRKYPDKPYPVTETQIKDQMEKEQADKNNAVQSKMMEWISRMRKKFNEKEETNG